MTFISGPVVVTVSDAVGRSGPVVVVAVVVEPSGITATDVGGVVVGGAVVEIVVVVVGGVVVVGVVVVVVVVVGGVVVVVNSGVLAAEDVDEPRRLVVSDLRIDASIAPVGVDDDGELAIPDDAEQLVWWQHGPVPGAPGSAVIAGHLDWAGVAGTFNRLGELEPGARIVVIDETGTSTSFRVTTVEIVDKARLSVGGTFARSGSPMLRLVTCGGAYDEDAHRYLSNVVVSAEPT